MAWMGLEARCGLRCCFVAIAAIAASLTVTSDVADARRHHRAHAHHAHVAHAGHGHGHRHARGEDYSPPYSSIVVDGNSGAVLQASNPDALRHPASLTKVMTLYLLFERLETGGLKLDSPLKVSEHASEQSPTKLNLKPGQTIAVEDAIKGIVTKSANDAAVAVAENLGGDEDSFAKLMTQKAHALGMTHTTYVNASGLPDDDQLTTARDQSLLGRAIQERFPRYYKYFSTDSFVYHGDAIRNHNHLLGAVEGVDGIKTGFTRASGFNLLTSMHRDSRYLVAVVMGGPSASERDDRMRELISAHIKEAALRHTATMIVETAERHDEAQPIAVAKPPTSRADHTATIEPHVAARSDDPIRPLLVRTISYRTASVQTASLVPMPALVPVAVPAPLPAPAQPAAPSQAAAPAPPQVRTEIAAAAPIVNLNAAAPQTEAASSATGPATAAEPTPAKVSEAEPAPLQPAQIESTPTESAAGGAATAQPDSALSAEPIRAHGGWLIQIGAFDDEDQAKQHLSDAQIKAHEALAAKDPFTEKVQKGDKALYRARFAGFDKATAEAACRTLKRSDFACMALKD
jgi:D-alanyl-D-alanine carboxypeptidase